VIYRRAMKTRGLLRDTIHLSVGQGFRLVIQAALLSFIARSLGPDAYGTFVTVVAMAALLWAPSRAWAQINFFIKTYGQNKRKQRSAGERDPSHRVFRKLLSALGFGLSLILHLRPRPLVVITVLRFRPGPA